MSFDLLAEFGEPAQNNGSSNQATTQPAKASSAFDDLSFFGGSTTSQDAQALPKIPSQVNDPWGDLSSFSSNIPNPAPSSSTIADPWGDLSSLAMPVKPVAKPQTPTYTYNESIRRNPTLQRAPDSPKTLAPDPYSRSSATTMQPAINPVQNLPNISSLHLSSKKPAKPKDDNVLFDAEDDQSDEDDFGDFETVEETVVPHAQAMATLDSDPGLRRPPGLSLGSNPQTEHFPYPKAPQSPGFQERNPYVGMTITTPTATPTKAEHTKAESPTTAWPASESKPPTATPYNDSPAPAQVDDDDWGDFTDMPASAAPRIAPTPAYSAQKPTEGIEADAWGWDAADDPPSKAAVQRNDIPPSNIPPPLILLSIYPQLFDLPTSALLKAIGGQPASLKAKIMFDPKTINFLKGYILLAMVAARIIAGRKLRWKRDTHLAQSMSISSAGGKGGMKLTNVDKSESIKEDREAADVVRIWKDQVGRLRSAVATANQSLHDQGAHLVIPDIQETMPIRVATSAEGGLTASKACIICGLKREERIARVDVNVDDTFGEWWVEHWGHRACKNFWLEHEGQLKSR